MLLIMLMMTIIIIILITVLIVILHQRGCVLSTIGHYNGLPVFISFPNTPDMTGGMTGGGRTWRLYRRNCLEASWTS